MAQVRELTQAELWTETRRHKLVGLCTALSGSRDAAEDLAQETLLEAWRNAHKLYDPAGMDRWLAAIARNVCRRWASQLRRSIESPTSTEPADTADGFDVEAELERAELVALLDEALALLPPVTRAVLLERFVYESSHARIAARLGLSPDAVSMRVSRGKIMLRGLLEPRLGEEATRSGPLGDGWQQTRVWCDCCGHRRLLMRRELPPGAVTFRCPGCSADPESVTSLLSLANPFFARLIGDLVRPSAILARTAQWVHHYYTEGLERGQVDCTRCGRRVPLQRGHPDPGRDSDAPPSAYAACEACGEAVSTSLHGLALAQPEIRRFGRGSRRLRELSGTRVDPAGSRTVVAFEDLVTAAHLEVEFDQETWRVLAVHGVPS